MLVARRLALIAASAVMTLAVATSARAQGNGRGRGNGHKSTPPSSSSLPGSPGSTTSASPLSWVDDASLLAPGSMSLTVSAIRWSGADLSEVYVPIVDAAVGLTNRLQLGASVPHVVGSADGTAVGGFGTSYISGKIAVLTEPDIKVAVSPILEILGAAPFRHCRTEKAAISSDCRSASRSRKVRSGCSLRRDFSRAARGSREAAPGFS